MKARSRLARRRLPADIVPNLAPLVDVVMVVLIFFMMGAAFSSGEAGLTTRLPADVGSRPGRAPAEPAPIQIDLIAAADAAACRIAIDRRPFEPASFDALAAELRRRTAAAPSVRVVISAGSRVRFQHVISALNACVQAGIADVRFAVQAGSE